MKKEPNGQLARPATRPGDAPAWQREFSSWGPFFAALAVFLLSGGAAAAEGDSPTQLRRFIDHQVGEIEKLMVPALDSGIPSPRLPD